MSEVTNPLQACNTIFVKPNSVFKALNEKSNWSWIPFFIVIAMSLLPAYLFINFVDFEWYKNILIDSQYGDVSPAEQDMVRAQMAKSSVMTFMMIGGIFGPIIINAVLALYLHLTTKSDEENLNGYTDWYGFTWWVGMPIVISSLIAIVLIAMSSDHQILPTIISPLSVAYLFNVDMASDWFAFAQSLRIDSLWTIYLITVGISQWTRFSTQKSATIAVAPFAVIWVVWAAINLL
ncbi:YIP1 family protein [Alteromonas gilva]|uniref:YIP1 family protein n=1 Tax=Alteromonas gilva TaxID=2987522 RepID=A0ABT5L420_9ALTE|nr:YIP1 family protein [Alteromonas gilva]MDC8831602.1 YIP1 family protein [Alteromonas gilva]